MLKFEHNNPKNVVLTVLMMLSLKMGRLRGNFITMYKCLIGQNEDGGGVPIYDTRGSGQK